MVTPEARPFAKTGGLADVAGALPLALGAARTPRHDRAAAVPRHPDRRRGAATPADVPFGLHSYPVRFIEQRAGGRRHGGARRRAGALRSRRPLRRRERRLPATTRAASRCSAAARSSTRGCAAARPSVVHAHDWQAGLAPVYLRTVLRDDPILGGVPTVFTIHNLAYQGQFPTRVAARGSASAGICSRVDALEFWGRVSFLKGGINFSDMITTVSPTYAQEIQTPEFGFGFDGILRERARRSRRDPQRHRHRRAGTRRPIRTCRRTSTPDSLEGKADVQARAARGARPAARRRGAWSGR